MSLSTHLLEVGPIDDPRPIAIHLPECSVDEGAACRVEVATHHDDELIKVQLLAVLNAQPTDKTPPSRIRPNQHQGITKRRQAPRKHFVRHEIIAATLRQRALASEWLAVIDAAAAERTLGPPDAE